MQAAIHVLAHEGARQLTHRRVDARAGLPEGTTSHSFRTSAALITGALEGVVVREGALLAAVGAVDSPDALVRIFVDLATALLGPHRDVTAARYAIMLEASHRPDLGEMLQCGRDQLVAAQVELFAAVGARDPHAAVALTLATFDGALLHGILFPASAAAAPNVVEQGVRAALAL